MTAVRRLWRDFCAFMTPPGLARRRSAILVRETTNGDLVYGASSLETAGTSPNRLYGGGVLPDDGITETTSTNSSPALTYADLVAARRLLRSCGSVEAGRFLGVQVLVGDDMPDSMIALVDRGGTALRVWHGIDEKELPPIIGTNQKP